MAEIDRRSILKFQFHATRTYSFFSNYLFFDRYLFWVVTSGNARIRTLNNHLRIAISLQFITNLLDEESPR